MYGRNAFSLDELIDFTPELRAQAVRNMERYKWYPGVVYNPPIVGNVNGLLGAINMGNANGGTNWPGGGYDPELHTVFAQAATASIAAESVAPPPPGFSDLPYQAGVVGQPFRLREAAGTGTYADVPSRGRGATPAATTAPPPATRASSGAPAPAENRNAGGLTVEGLPIVKPPYGVLAAIDLERGAVAWKVPHGETPDVVRNHPLLKGMNIPRTGQNGSVGLLVTKTLVVLGDPQVTTTAARPRGAMLRAYDKKTGKEVGAVFMPAPQSGSPMTYMANGRQFIVVAISGGPYSGEYLAFSLPVN
jgi:quinoprotein glucose dehydrogenase